MANVFANYGLNYAAIDINLLIRAQTGGNFYDNIEYEFNGRTYQDLAEFQYFAGGRSYSAGFGGADVTFGPQGQATGGTVTGYLESVWNGSQWSPMWGIQDIEYSAVSLANVAYTVANGDDLAAIAQILSGNDQIYLSNYSDVFRGYTGDDIMYAQGGNDTLYGDDGRDLLAGGSGNDILSGGAGIDAASFTGNLNEYNLSRQSLKAVNVVDLVKGRDGSDSLIGVERFHFSDVSVALDVGQGESAGAIYRLYEAAFDRAPKPAGEGFWLNKLENGETLVQIAEQFLQTAEFKSMYGENPTHGFYVTQLFENVLGRVPKQAGLDYFTRYLEQGGSRADVLVDISESSENVDNVATLIANGILYEPFG